MIIFRDISTFNDWRKAIPSETAVAFVPTMGALHQGHAELLRQARKQAEIVVLSIYVNPTQFNDPKDFEKYPSTGDQDVKIAESEKVDAIFAPTYPQMYPDQYRYQITEKQFSLDLCGAHRPGHFDGVLTVVMKLLQIVRPQMAFFGEKDYQQLQLIRGMVEAFFLPVQIISVPTVRETDGLAMSSRNLRLSASQRQRAPLLYKTICAATSAEEAHRRLQEQGFQVDYVKDIGSRRFVAAFLGEVRLIDNVQI